jgi:NitT/TauT family transport system permease protein
MSASAMSQTGWFAVRAALSPRRRTLIGVGSFLLPLLVWCLLSYLPFVWHPQVLVTQVGDVDYFQPGMRVDKAMFAEEAQAMKDAGKAVPEGEPANPVYLPAPHEVARAFYTAFTTAPEQKDAPWLHESLWANVYAAIAA